MNQTVKKSNLILNFILFILNQIYHFNLILVLNHSISYYLEHFPETSHFIKGCLFPTSY